MTATTPDPPGAASGASPTPRRLRTPSWMDMRFLIGVGLVLASVAVGARVVASSDDRVGVWQATRDLAPGAVLTAQDIQIARVRLPSTDQYVTADKTIIGTAISRPVDDGELLPRSSIADVEPGVTLTIPVGVEDAPSVRRGQRVAIWVSTSSCEALLVLPDVVAQDVVAPRSGALSGSSRMAITVRLPIESAPRVISALALPESVIRVGVLSGSGAAEPVDPGEVPDIRDCGAGR